MATLVTCFPAETKLISGPGRASGESVVQGHKLYLSSLCLCLAACAAPHAQTPAREWPAAPAVNGWVRLPGLAYRVLRSGPRDGPRPRRSDEVRIRYVARLADGSVFSTSAGNGTLPSTFEVRTVIPGFSALVQLMRPGDRWRFAIPAFLGYGHEGRRFIPPEATLKRDVPPNSDLEFDVELVAIVPHD